MGSLILPFFDVALLDVFLQAADMSNFQDEFDGILLCAPDSQGLILASLHGVCVGVLHSTTYGELWASQLDTALHSEIRIDLWRPRRERVLAKDHVGTANFMTPLNSNSLNLNI